MHPDEIDLTEILAALPQVHVDQIDEQDMAQAFAITADTDTDTDTDQDAS